MAEELALFPVSAAQARNRTEPFATQPALPDTMVSGLLAGRIAQLASGTTVPTVPSPVPTEEEADTLSGTVMCAIETIPRQAASNMGRSGTLSAKPTSMQLDAVSAHQTALQA